MSEWIPVKTRPLTEDEKEEFIESGLVDYNGNLALDNSIDDMFVYDCELPSDDEIDVLITSDIGEVVQTTFNRDINCGCYFESYEDAGDVLAWMPLPEPYKAESEE